MYVCVYIYIYNNLYVCSSGEHRRSPGQPYNSLIIIIVATIMVILIMLIIILLQLLLLLLLLIIIIITTNTTTNHNSNTTDNKPQNNNNTNNNDNNIHTSCRSARPPDCSRLVMASVTPSASNIILIRHTTYFYAMPYVSTHVYLCQHVSIRVLCWGHWNIAHMYAYVCIFIMCMYMYVYVTIHICIYIYIYTYI